MLRVLKKDFFQYSGMLSQLIFKWSCELEKVTKVVKEHIRYLWCDIYNYDYKLCIVIFIIHVIIIIIYLWCVTLLLLGDFEVQQKFCTPLLYSCIFGWHFPLSKKQFSFETQLRFFLFVFWIAEWKRLYVTRVISLPSFSVKLG